MPQRIPHVAHITSRWRLLAMWIAIVLLASGTPLPVATAGTAARPNVLLIITDDQAWSNFSRPLMPRVFADIVDRGALFTRTYVASPVCCPSRAEIFTGLYEHHTNVDTNGAVLTRPTIVKALHDTGYRTMMAGKYLNSWTQCGPRPEYDRWSCVGTPAPSTYSQIDPWINVDGTLTHFSGIQSDILASQVADFVAATPEDRPFFAVYAPTSPHSPADDPRYATMPVTVPRPPSWNVENQTTDTPTYMRRPPLGDGLIASTNTHYRKANRSVRGLDDSIGLLLDAIESRADDTLVIFVSDNGYSFGEHRRVAKFDPYDESARVPLAIRYPALLPTDTPISSDALVSNVDLAPTILEAAGIPWASDGTSITPLLTGDASRIHDAILLERCRGSKLVTDPCTGYRFEGGMALPPEYEAAVTERYKYIEYVTGERQLFDLNADPGELHNLHGLPEVAGDEAAMAEALDLLRAPPPIETAIVTGPSGAIASRTVSFSLFTQSRFASFLCRLTQDELPGPWRDCSSGTYVHGGLPDGTYLFEAAATDETGQVDETPAARTFQVSTAGGPQVSITSGPPMAQTSRSAAFGFESSLPGAGFECRMDLRGAREGGWEACDATQGATYVGLADGIWEFRVRAVDATSGLYSMPPDTRIVAIDDQGPSFRFAERPADVTSSSSAWFRFVPSEPVAGSVSCVLDQSAASACDDGVFGAADLIGGVHTLSISASDGLGNLRTTDMSWRRDRTRPSILVSSGPAPVSRGTSATFGFSSNETPSAFACSVDGSPEMPCSASWRLAGLSQGAHTLTAWALDRVLNRSDPLTYTWTIDTTAPVLTLSGGPRQGTTTTSRSASFTFTLNEPGTIRCRLDTGAFAPCASPKTYSNLLPGSHAFRVYGVDVAGNRSATRTRSWTVA